MALNPPPSVLLVEIDRGGVEAAGRDRMTADLLADLAALEAAGALRLQRVTLVRRRPGRALLAWLTSTLTLPESLYRLDPRGLPARVDTVLLSGWPAQGALAALAARYPRARILADLDDAYPDRLAGWRRAGVGYAAGLLGRVLPAPLRRVLEGPAGRPLNLIEQARGRWRIRRIARRAEAIFLSGGREAAAYAARLDGLCSVQFMPPAFRIRRRPGPRPETGPARFVFLGSDRLVQNASALGAVAAHWPRLHAHAPLDLYSRHEAPRHAPGWRYRGFAATLDEVFSDGAALLYPARIPGGIKIKLVEALEHGCPAITTRAGIEGFAMDAVLDGLWVDFDRLVATGTTGATGAEKARIALPDPDRIAAAQDRVAAGFAAHRAAGLRRLCARAVP